MTVSITFTDPSAKDVATLSTLVDATIPKPGILPTPPATAPSTPNVALPVSVFSMKLVGNVLTFINADNSTVSFTGVLVTAPAVLPAGIAPNSQALVTVVPGSAVPNLETALLMVKDGGIISVAAGTYHGHAHIDAATFPSGLNIIGAGGAYKTILDGQGGVGAGHRLAWGKGIIHITAPNCLIEGIGFINGGGADKLGDGEAGIYSEQTTGSLTVHKCAFDGNENGIFVQNTVPVVIMEDNDFGRNVPNGASGDGLSHDIYSNAHETREAKSRHYNCQNGHGLKTRSSNVTTSDNYYAANGGRCIDVPDATGSVWNSTNDSFTQLPNASTNLVAYGDESNHNGLAGAVMTNATVAISRGNTVIWAGNGTTMNFVNPTLSSFNTAASLQNQGTVTGLPALPASSGNGLAVPVSPLV